MAPIDEIMKLLEKGNALTQADVDEIDYLVTQLDPEADFDSIGMVYEGIAMIANDPAYAGDIKAE